MALGKLSVFHTLLFLENEAQINKTNYATMLFMSKQVSPAKIALNPAKIAINPKCYIRPFCTKAFKYKHTSPSPAGWDVTPSSLPPPFLPICYSLVG